MKSTTLDRRGMSSPRGSISLRRNFVWTFVGTIVYALSQWLLLVAIARFGTPRLVGQYALALAVSAPVYLTFGLNLRVVRATDVRRTWTTRQYDALRFVLNAVSLVVALALGLFFGLGSEGFLVLAVVCLSKAAEASSQVIYGYFQLRERLDLVARSLIARALLGSGAFVGAFLISGKLVVGCLGLFAGWMAVYILHDRPIRARLHASDTAAIKEEGLPQTKGTTSTWRLARKAAPLGIDAGVGSIATNVPRYSVQFELGTASLGVFAALAYMTQIISIVTGALGDSIIGRLAKLYERRNARGFSRLLVQLVAFGFAVSLIAAGGAWLLGAPIVRWLLGTEYVNQPVLIILMLGVGMITLQRSLNRGLQAAHRYGSVLAVDTTVMALALLLSLILVPAHGLIGAAAVLLIASAVGAIVSGAVLIGVLSGMRGEEMVVAR